MFKPYGPRLLVRPVDPNKVTAGGIVLPDQAAEYKRQGTVVEVGLPPSSESRLKEIPVGATVWWAGYAGTEIVDEDKIKYTILEYEDIIAWELPQEDMA